MNTIVRVMTVTVLIFISAPGDAFGGWTFSLFNKDASFDIWLNTDEQITLRGYTLHFEYIPTETESMGWDGMTYHHIPPGTLSEMFGVPYAVGDCAIMNLNASTFGSGTQVSSGLMIARFPFAGPGYFDWAQDYIGFSADVNGIIYSGRAVPTTQTPLPPTTWLLASGLLGIAGLRGKLRRERLVNTVSTI